MSTPSCVSTSAYCHTSGFYRTKTVRRTADEKGWAFERMQGDIGLLQSLVDSD